jgi:hypothetical protein
MATERYDQITGEMVKERPRVPVTVHDSPDQRVCAHLPAGAGNHHVVAANRAGRLVYKHRKSGRIPNAVIVLDRLACASAAVKIGSRGCTQ